MKGYSDNVDNGQGDANSDRGAALGRLHFHRIHHLLYPTPLHKQLDPATDLKLIDPTLN